MVSHPPGLIGVLSGDLARWTWFSQSLLALDLPRRSAITWACGSWIAVAVNKLIASMEPHHEWICILADDHTFPPWMLTRLLDHGCDIVAPLCCLRRYPYGPSIFAELTTGTYAPLSWNALAGKSGLMAVDAMGGPGVVIRRHVLDAIDAPWFEGQAGEQPREDLTFFSKCRRAGYQPRVDLELPIGHCLPAAVYPHRTEDGTHRVRLWSYEDLCLLPRSTAPMLGASDYHAYT